MHTEHDKRAGVRERRVALSTFGCDAAQGYFLARPLDRESVASWLDARRSSFAASVLRAA